MAHLNASTRQRGAALLLSLMAMVLLITASVAALRPDIAYQHARDTRDAKRLREVKERLVAYAVAYADLYGDQGAGVGHLPCPDRTLDDNRHPTPPCSTALDRFGWLPSGIQLASDRRIEFYAEDEDPLWYAVSESFKNNPILPVNSDTRGDLQVDGEDNVVAVIIDPGQPLPQQQRPSLEPANYLEGENARPPYTRFVTRDNGDFNDRLMVITRDELMPLIEKRVLGYVQSWFRRFEAEHNYLPELSPMEGNRRTCIPTSRAGWVPSELGICQSQLMPDGRSQSLSAPHWFERNGWREYIWVHYIERCGFAQSLCNSNQGAPLTVNNAPAKVLLVARGQAIATESKGGAQQQTQPHSPLWQDYLDSEESADGDMTFEFERLGPQHNDQFLAW